MTFLMNFDLIQLAQQQDATLQQLRQQKPQEYVLRQNGQHNLIYHWERIFIPQNYAPRIIPWYHNALNHPGIQKLLNNFNQHFFSPQVIKTITDIVSNCKLCQRNKTSNMLTFNAQKCYHAALADCSSRPNCPLEDEDTRNRGWVLCNDYHK